MAVRKYSVQEILGVIARRRWILLLPLAIGAAMAPVLARYAPERYRSEALIVVIPQQVPDNYVQPTVSESVASRLPALTDQILSRNRLELIIQEMDLYPRERARWVMEDVVGRMRGDIQTTAVGRQVNSFRVSYTSNDPEKARIVTDRLARLYQDQSSADRSNQANMTSEFLETQLAEARQRLIEQEKRLEDYRTANSGELPSQMQSNLQAIQNANLQLQSLSESTNRAQERRLLFERQLADARALQASQPTPAATPTPDGATNVSTARQLEAAQARLTALLQRNTPDHPDMVTLRRVVEDLQVRLAEEGAASAEAGVPPVPTLSPQELAQQRRIGDLEAELLVIDRQLESNQANAARLTARIAEYQAKVDAMPSRESELVELTRDYGTMQTAYAQLLMKQQNAVIAANLEHRRIGEQFRLVDVASRPQRPDNQRERLAIMASGAIGGAMLSVFLVVFLELRDSSFRRPEEVIQALSLPVLASIPVMTSDREHRRRSRRRWLVDIAGVAVVVVAAAVLALWRLQS